MKLTSGKQAVSNCAQDYAIVGLIAALSEIQARLAALPVLDDRSQEEIIGYDEFGLPS